MRNQNAQPKAAKRRPEYYAYNVTRQALINLGVRVADTPLSRLRGLLGKVRLRSDEAVWIVPSRGVHTIGLLFPIDLIYLDSQMQVVALVENLGPFRVAPLRWQCASVLELPARTIYESGTRPGDQFLICTQEKLDEYWDRLRQKDDTLPKAKAAG